MIDSYLDLSDEIGVSNYPSDPVGQGSFVEGGVSGTGKVIVLDGVTVSYELGCHRDEVAEARLGCLAPGDLVVVVDATRVGANHSEERIYG